MPVNPSDNVCKWINLQSALATFATYTGAIQSQQHIKPLHHYVACRLVVEGGFLPEEITPRPPFRSQRSGKSTLLLFDQSVATGTERTVLGGLKTKNVDVVVTKEGLGPVMSISCKGAIGAFRNLTNRMEEAVGDCTNLHITYPAMVTGYLFAMRAHPHDALAAATVDEPIEGRAIGKNDIALRDDGEPVEAIVRFHNALRELTNRRGVRDDVSRYESVSLMLIAPRGATPGSALSNFPTLESPLRFDRFFPTIYQRYDERYVYGAPDLEGVTRRREWSTQSPALTTSGQVGTLDYEARIVANDG